MTIEEDRPSQARQWSGCSYCSNRGPTLAFAGLRHSVEAPLREPVIGTRDTDRVRGERSSSPRLGVAVTRANRVARQGEHLPSRRVSEYGQEKIRASAPCLAEK